MNTTLSKQEILGLIGKYSIALIVYQVISRFGLNFGIQLYADLFPVDLSDTMKSHTSYFSLVADSISLIFALIYAIFLLKDMDLKKRISWAIFMLSIFNPWAGTAFLILMKIIDWNYKAEQ